MNRELTANEMIWSYNIGDKMLFKEGWINY